MNRGDSVEEKLKVLTILLENKNLNQRNLSKLVNFSLGKVNNILKDCLENELIENNLYNKDGKYIVTKKGEELLRRNIREIKERKLTINEEANYKISNAVILAAGKRNEFDIPIGALKVDEETVIERTIRILKENGVENIFIVVGYKYQCIQALYNNDDSIKFLKNERYQWTGTMYSLSLVKEYIDDDFLLIEGDLIYEKRAINRLVDTNKRDCIIITNESGSGDEAFVHIKNNLLFKMSKDIHQFNKIDGEMIGISKISYKLFKMMMEEYIENINPYLNYEYIMLDVARDYKVYCEKIDDLAWGEIDTIKQYEYSINELIPKIKRREYYMEIQKIKEIIVNYLNVTEENISNITLAGGMTNKNYRVSIGAQEYILRIPGLGTESMISRKNEMVNSNLSSDLGLNVDVLAFDEEKGIKISKFIVDAETLNPTTAKKEENMKKVASSLRTLHNSKIEMKNTFNVFEEIIKYENILDKIEGKYYEDYNEVRVKVMSLQNIMKDYGAKLTPAHNDTVPENFVKDKEGKMYLIDWEYSGLNDPMWDVAAHSLECSFNKEEEELFLSYYFNGEVTEEDRIRILINKICQDFLWAVWTLIKEHKGDDFGTYGIDRYNRAKTNIEELFNLI